MREPVSIPDLTPLRQALDSSSALVDLQRRLQLSQQRLAVVQSIVPAALAGDLGAGQLDDAGWTLTVRSNAAAAKLRHWVPIIEDTLQARGLKVNSIRIKIQSVTT